MARGYNHVTLEGNLARDPDVRFTPNKQKCARITIAIGDDYKGKDGNIVKHTDFIDCVAWGVLADIIEKYTAKGQAILVDGQIKKRDYEKDGQKKYITEVLVKNVVLLSFAHKNDSGSSDSGYQPTDAAAPAPASQQEDPGEEEPGADIPDVNIPF